MTALTIPLPATVSRSDRAPFDPQFGDPLT